ncbi:Ankyrin-2 (ANK-2) (Ankyrin-B) (Brain ankyrin) (Non-erythroid ankyrin) [Durusdinium trenchii]|uniref:Ankyrin-2 (ANK-2) (Ankyrin-B) (Brain ankyrin) (Non-erythroid ankyrin) n=1 Tax=Durusdinium trenchii TaxID=1381693 RepID=A0ABP0RGM1_9DINO
MWVVKVEHLLKMRERFRPHQTLKAEGLLEKWSPKMFTIFVSHQWLGRHHPDPNGEQLRVLQGCLSNLIARKLKIETDVLLQWNGGRLTEAELRQIRDAYLWLDYFCVPQLVDDHADGLAEDQLQYVHTIPSYVDHCNLFLALVPKARHETGSPCSFHSWLARGWCRTELWCHFLSSKVPIVAVKSHDLAQFVKPQWHRYPVHLGDFGVEKDRSSCRSVIRTALTQYLAQLSLAKNKTVYRLYLSLFEDMTGLASELRSVEEFLMDFSFSKPLNQHRGLGPVACAALSGDVELIRNLVMAKASLQSHMPGLPEVMNLPDFTPVHLAVWFRSQDLRILETLLDLRADPNSCTLNVDPPLGFCRTAGAVELLVRHKAGVNLQGKTLGQLCPIHSVAAFGAPCEVLATLLELRADVTGGRGGFASASPLHFIAFCGDSPNELRSAQLLLESRADMNQVCQPEGLLARSVQWISQAYSKCCSKPSAVVRWLRDVSSTPLGWCVTFENEDYLAFLLRAGADPEVRNSRGLRPIDMGSRCAFAHLHENLLVFLGHGTGTALGDPIEVGAIKAALGRQEEGSPQLYLAVPWQGWSGYMDRPSTCCYVVILSAGKSNHGHLEGAAGPESLRGMEARSWWLRPWSLCLSEHRAGFAGLMKAARAEAFLWKTGCGMVVPKASRPLAKTTDETEKKTGLPWLAASAEVAACLQRHEVPPNIHFQEPHEKRDEPTNSVQRPDAEGGDVR